MSNASPPAPQKTTPQTTTPQTTAATPATPHESSIDGAPVMQPERRVMSIAELTFQIRDLLQAQFSNIWISGEVSDLARPKSGHLYLTLKDDEAQIKGVMWRSAAQRLKFDLEDGMEIICQGNIDIYPPRGSYQFQIRKIELRGEGAQQRALKKLHAKLAQEGLFDAYHKQTLPTFPRRVAVVTSPTGAAIHDFLQVARRRWQGVHVIVVPTKVQGPGAAQEVTAAIRTAASIQPSVDAVVVTRGGGSSEDLNAFKR